MVRLPGARHLCLPRLRTVHREFHICDSHSSCVPLLFSGCTPGQAGLQGRGQCVVGMLLCSTAWLLSVLQDVVCGRKTQGVVRGSISVNGHPKEQATWSRVVG